MHFIIYALGTLGDIGPMCGLAAELTRRGHSVSFLSNAYFQQTIASVNCDFVPVGTIAEYHKGNTDKAWQVDNFEDNFEHYHVPAFEPSFRYVQTNARADSVAIILGNNSGVEAACELGDIPYIKVMLSPNVVFSAISPAAPLRWAIPASAPRWLVRVLLNRYRKIKFRRFCKARFTEHYRQQRERLGCPIRYRKEDEAQLQIGLFPEWYASPPQDWPSKLKLCNFPMTNLIRKDCRQLFDQICERLGAPVIFTAGSGRSSAKQLFVEGRKVCEQLNVPGVFVGGGDSVALLDGANYCAHIDYIDFQYAFSKASVVVHHGGIGTVAQAIRAGCPQLICPVKYDQPDNADRIYRLGLGSYILPEQFIAENIAPMIQRMVAQSSQVLALKHYAAKIERVDAIGEACDLIESVGREG